VVDPAQVVQFLTERFIDHSQLLIAALRRANDHAWRALELALAGGSWWDQVKVSLARREDQAFREQVSAFLRATPLAGLPSHGPEFRQQALGELRAARKAGLLLSGDLDPVSLSQEAAPFPGFADPLALLEREGQTLDRLAGIVKEAGYPTLGHFLSLRPQGATPLLVVAVRYFFRREIETNQSLFAGLMFSRVEQMSQVQEAGFDALFTALQQHGHRVAEVLTDVLAVATQTQADVQDIKAALARHGQQLHGVGEALLRHLMPAAVPTVAGLPPREEDVRLEMLNTLLITPHRRLEQVWPVHQQLVTRDPRFYVRLAAWYFDKGEVRDHKEAFVVSLVLSTFPGHRDVGLALLRRFPPYQVVRVVDFIHGRKETRRRVSRAGAQAPQPSSPSQPPKRGPGRYQALKPPTEPQPPRGRAMVREVVGSFGLFRSLPRSLCTEVTRYLREREAIPEWFDSTVLVARKALKRLYALLHIAPSERAQQILFKEQPPPDSRLALLKNLSGLTTPEAQAQAILEARIPFRIAVSVLPSLTPRMLETLIERMSPQELINSLGMLQRHGALAHPDLKALIDLKLEEARSSRSVNVFKAEKAMQTVDLGGEYQQKLEDLTDVQIKARGRIRRPTALLVDKSGSMELALDVGKRVAAMISAVCDQALYVYAFDTMAYPIEAVGKDWASWKKAFEGIMAAGETSVGVALEIMRRRQQVVEQIIVVTDEEEYAPPFFVESLLKYRQAFGIDPAVCFLKVADSSTRLEDQCRRSGIVYSTFQFTGDYYALPNLIPLLEPPGGLDLLLEIMDYPLPSRLLSQPTSP
jgi:hypothetical protein